MSYPNPTIFFIVVYREEMSGPQYKVLTSVSGLTGFLERHEYDKRVRDYDAGEFDIFMVDTEAFEVTKYDSAPLLAMLPKWVTPKNKKAGSK